MNRTLLTGLLALSLNIAFAADLPAPAEPTDKLAGARAQVSAKNWVGAIDELKRVNATGSADCNTLRGYRLRTPATPDLAGSEKYYNDALRIDPKHRGTLAYSGELYLTKGDLAMAEQRLATLDKACNASCAEYAELKNSIARYKANGNKVAAGSGY
jgi:tetratricopeptide (TPR) repeat protein